MTPAPDLLSERLAPEDLRLLREVGQAASAVGMRAYLVGGTVRDLILGRAAPDLDVAVEGDAVALARRLAQRWQTKALAHDRFGTAVVQRDTRTIDLAGARTETYARPGALPKVRPSTLVEDLRRRDFTINAIAASLSPEDFGALVDPHGGQADLQHRLVRALHDGSFIDDPTRILRAVRYEQRLRFAIEPHTLSLLRHGLTGLKNVSGDRLRGEVERILLETEPEQGIVRAEALGVWEHVHVALRPGVALEKRFAEVRSLRLTEDLPMTYLAAWLYPSTLSQAQDALKLLRFPKAWQRAVLDAQAIKSLGPELARPSLRPSEAYEWLIDRAPEAVLARAASTEHGVVRAHLMAHLREQRAVKTLLTGNDLPSLGVPRGPIMREALQGLLHARLDGEVSSREQEQAWIRRWLAQKQKP